MTDERPQVMVDPEDLERFVEALRVQTEALIEQTAHNRAQVHRLAALECVLSVVLVAVAGMAPVALDVLEQDIDALPAALEGKGDPADIEGIIGHARLFLERTRAVVEAASIQ